MCLGAVNPLRQLARRECHSPETRETVFAEFCSRIAHGFAHTKNRSENIPSDLRLCGGRYKIRTCDLFRVSALPLNQAP